MKQSMFGKRIGCILLTLGMLAGTAGCTLPLKEQADQLMGSHDSKSFQYMIYYGMVDEEVIEIAKGYQMVILHPTRADLTRKEIAEIQEGINPNDPSDDVKVIGYVSIGEDLRTAGLTPAQMKKDKRFQGDGTGPRVDARSEGTEQGDLLGKPSPGGTGYASWYLDDNNFDGKPDVNQIFKAAFVNAGDPKWYQIVNRMCLDREDKTCGLAEIMTTTVGRGLGCDGVFLDTVDTCAPNYYTDETSLNQSEFEWTAPGYTDFIRRLREDYPDKIIVQNRGLFFYNPNLPQYRDRPSAYVDYVLFESFRLDSTTTELYSENFFLDNLYNYAPRLIAEANRPDGFQVLSLGYAEGPPELISQDTLLGDSDIGYETLIEDIHLTSQMGFVHYLTNASVDLPNSFVKENIKLEEDILPEWLSTYNESNSWPATEPPKRVGIQKVIAKTGAVVVNWDVATSKNGVIYHLYYQELPFDYDTDPNLTRATKIELVPQMGEGYDEGTGPTVFPYQATVTGLKSGVNYHFMIRACDKGTIDSEEKNKVSISAIPN